MEAPYSRGREMLQYILKLQDVKGGVLVPVAARFKAARLLRSWVQLPPGAWMFVCCESGVRCQVEVSATS